MIDLFEPLQDTFTFQEEEYIFQTDFHKWLCFPHLVDEYIAEKKEPDFKKIAEFFEVTKKPKHIDDIYGLEAQCFSSFPASCCLPFFLFAKKFYSPSPSFVSLQGEGQRNNLLSLQKDADMIYCAFFQCYHIDLASPLHYHAFLALLGGIQGTKLNDILCARAYSGRDREMQKEKRYWALPVELNKEEQEALNEFNQKGW